MSDDDPDDPAIGLGEERMAPRDARDAALNDWLIAEIGHLSLDTVAFSEHGRAALASLEQLSGNDCLWVLAAVIGGVICDAPRARHQRLLLACHALVAYSVERGMEVRSHTPEPSDEAGSHGTH